VKNEKGSPIRRSCQEKNTSLAQETRFLGRVNSGPARLVSFLVCALVFDMREVSVLF
jgi:hypothetical protein